MKLEYETIQKLGGIGIVRFDRKANLNAFDEKLVVELTYAARTFSTISEPNRCPRRGTQCILGRIRFKGHRQLAQ